MWFFNWLRTYKVYVDATISNSQDPKLPKKAYVSYFVAGLNLSGIEKIDEYQTDKAEQKAIIFALDNLEKPLKRFTIYCDHKGTVDKINDENIKLKKNTSQFLIKIRDRLDKKRSINVKQFPINPAHTHLKKHLKAIKANPE